MSSELVYLGKARTGDERGDFAVILGRVLEETPQEVKVQVQIAFQTNDKFLRHTIYAKICAAGVVPDGMPGHPWCFRTNGIFVVPRKEVGKMEIALVSPENISAAAICGSAKLGSAVTGKCVITTYVGDVIMTTEAKGVQFTEIFDGPGLNPTPSCTAFAAELAIWF